MQADNSFVARGQKRPFALILGTNEVASAIAAHMSRFGWAAALSHDPFPPVTRRQMSFHDCLFGERIVLDSVAAERAETSLELVGLLDRSQSVAVTPLQFHDLVALRMPDALVDARMQPQRVVPDLRHLAGLTIGVGPHFADKRNCDIAIASEPAAADRLEQVGAARFVHAPRRGLWHTAVDIGVRVFKGFVVGHLDGEPIEAPLDGVLRGVVRDGLLVPAGVELLEIDPRGRAAKWKGVEEATELIASAVVRAVRVELAKRAAAPAPGPIVAH
jgi:xanthine dehydrogenase accessory factor